MAFLNLVAAVISAVILIMALQPYEETYHYSITFKGGRAALFTYYMNPKNFQQINPTIIDLTVIRENEKVVEARYQEHLMQLPFIFNNIHSIYHMQTGPRRNAKWTITSTHTTCFWTYLCMKVDGLSEFEEEDNGKSVRVHEAITIRPPAIFRHFAGNEVRMQRRLIYANLRTVFV